MHQPDVENVLDQTYSALLQGDLAQLSRLTADLTSFQELRPVELGAAERLRRKAERNQRLLRAAAQGVRTARGRLAEILTGPALTTYDAKGQKASVGKVAAGQPKRF